MNYKMMGRFLAQILSLEGVLMLPAAAISLYCGDMPALRGFLIAIAVAMGLPGCAQCILCKRRLCLRGCQLDRSESGGLSAFLDFR